MIFSSLDLFIKDFCKVNTNKKRIDFDIFKNPKNLYAQYGNGYAYNTFKGTVFELLLSELYRGNGYLVNRVAEEGKDGGCDLMIKNPNDNSIRFILQAKNYNRAIAKPDIIVEFTKFQDNYKRQYNLNNSHFCFVAWKYVKEIKNKITNKLNINIRDEEDILNDLFHSYKCRYPKYPSILLDKYPHQQNAFNNIIRFWKNNKRCYVEHASGTGKTYIIAKLVEYIISNPKNKILILSPSTYINDRLKKTVSRVISSDKISIKFKPKKLINILTYQYLFHKSSQISSKDFTHIIMDEAHRAGAPKWHTIGLLPIINPKTKIVGMSATMERYSQGFDIKQFLGNNCAGELSLFKAITRGILPPIGKYVYSILDIKTKVVELKDEVECKYKKSSKKKDKILSRFNAKQIKDYSIQNIIYKHYKSMRYHKIIAFCEGFEHTNEIRRLLGNTFTIFSKVDIKRINSQQSKKENKLILDTFSYDKPSKNQIKIILAIDMLNEGIDVSGIDSIMLFRRTESPRVYFQQLGRVLRSRGKDNPLIFDCVLNYQNIKVNLLKEAQKEIKQYQKYLIDFGFTDIEIPKTINIIDEVKDISKIIQEVEVKLNFYRLYEDAKESVKNLNIKSESEYRNIYRKDVRLPSKPHRSYKDRGWVDWYEFLGVKKKLLYQTLDEAKQSVLKLGINSASEYRKRRHEDTRLPATPSRTYKDKGWINFFDFLGKPYSHKYNSYIEAKNAVRHLAIKTNEEYKKRYKEDSKLLSKPDKKYRNRGWVDWYDFLGVKKKLIYQTLDEAKQSVLKLGINSYSEYRKRRHEDPRLPATPSKYYRNKGWVDFFDFLGKPYSQKYTNYIEAKKAVRILSIKTRKEYHKRYKEDPKLPSSPRGVYKNRGWITFKDFIGAENKNFYKTIAEAKESVLKLRIKSRKEYVEQKRYKEDSRLPSQPNIYYRNKGWVKWEEFIVLHYLTYGEAEAAVQKLEIKSRADYIKNKRYKEDKLLPSDPQKKYFNKGWVSWHHFLGNKEQINYKSYKEAETAVRRLKIKSMKEYKSRRKEDPRLPSSPSESYRNKGWISSQVFLNIKIIAPYKTYMEAQRAAQKLNIKNKFQYVHRKKYKGDSRLTSTPDKLYKLKGWKDWNSFLGVQPIDFYPTYEEAKQAVQKLNIKLATAYRKLYKEDPRLPSTPSMKYKDKGWINFSSFLGTQVPIKYSTYEEARIAARKLKIKSRIEYYSQKRYLEDSGLTYKPDKKFKNKGWVSWEDFLGI